MVLEHSGQHGADRRCRKNPRLERVSRAVVSQDSGFCLGIEVGSLDSWRKGKALRLQVAEAVGRLLAVLVVLPDPKKVYRLLKGRLVACWSSSEPGMFACRPNQHRVPSVRREL
jgi:hypothetical protein